MNSFSHRARHARSPLRRSWRSCAALIAALALATAAVPSSAWAQLDAIRSEFSAALRDAQATQKSGPAIVPLMDEATLQLPAEYVFVPMPAAARLLKAMGNRVDPHLVGVVFPGHDENWLMVVQFEKTGFIREDDARQWNVDELLRSVREGTERGNEQRRAQGLPEIEVTGWVEKPSYDVANHRLVWAVAAHDSGSATDKDTGQGVNYNTYMLGRDGYFKFNLVTDLKDLSGQQAAADAVTASLNYLEGKRYQDFDAASDPVADFSIAALVAGIAVKKLGFPAVLAAVAAKFSLAIAAAAILVLAGLFAYLALRRRARRKRLAEDFPSTELHTEGLDGPTLALFEYPQTETQVWTTDDDTDNGPPTVANPFGHETEGTEPASNLPIAEPPAAQPPTPQPVTAESLAALLAQTPPATQAPSAEDAAPSESVAENAEPLPPAAPEPPEVPEPPVPMLPVAGPPAPKLLVPEPTEPPMSEPPLTVVPDLMTNSKRKVNTT